MKQNRRGDPLNHLVLMLAPALPAPLTQFDTQKQNEPSVSVHQHSHDTALVIFHRYTCFLIFCVCARSLLVSCFLQWRRTWLILELG